MQKGNSTSTQFLETLRKRVKKPTQNELAASQLQKKRKLRKKKTATHVQESTEAVFEKMVAF